MTSINCCVGKKVVITLRDTNASIDLNRQIELQWREWIYVLGDLTIHNQQKFVIFAFFFFVFVGAQKRYAKLGPIITYN